MSTPSVREAIEANDLDGLVRLVDGFASSREWDAIIDLRHRCREAVERGKQLWGVAHYANYRLALDAPPLPAVNEAMAEACVMSAHGNSGMLLSQFLIGFRDEIGTSHTADVHLVAKAFRRGGVWDPESWPSVSDTAVCEMFNDISGTDMDPAEMRRSLEADYAASLAAELVD